MVGTGCGDDRGRLAKGACNGFCETRARRVGELAATLHEYVHEASGARLVWIERPDENKTFGIAFTTPPVDDTGVFHILEHSVLCGSRRYPAHEPFVDLLKGSLNTFLNAMTYSDKTLYPVSSRNDADFMNLMRVYMDAVLNPLIYERPQVFYQEGWRYVFPQGEGDPVYQGVVLNEMKGAMSDPDALLEARLKRLLFPDTCYRFNSGGDPASIPSLSYERFLKTHRRLYRPSNARIFLDGDMDIDSVLHVLDAEFLAAFPREGAAEPEEIVTQAPVVSGRSELPFELGASEPLEGRSRLVVASVFGDYASREELWGLRALSETICGDTAAPLNRALVESGLARDVSFEVVAGIRQPWAQLEVSDIRTEDADKVRAVLYDEIGRLAREGVSRERLRSALANAEFLERQRDYGGTPLGVVLCGQVLDSWLYEGDPALNLEVRELFEGLEGRIESGWFEELLSRTFLSPGHAAEVLMVPSHDLGQRRREEEAGRIHAERARWTPRQESVLRERQRMVEQWQTAPDDVEGEGQVPRIQLSQISTEPALAPLETWCMDGVDVLHHVLPSDGIVHFSLNFDAGDLSYEDLSRLSFATELMGEVATAAHGREDLLAAMRLTFGLFDASVEAIGRHADPTRCRTQLALTGSVLETKLVRALGLASEVLKTMRLDDSESVRDILHRTIAAIRQDAASRGNVYARMRLESGLAAVGAANEAASGISYLRWLSSLEDAFDGRWPTEAERIKGLLDRVCCLARLTVGATGSADVARAIVAGVDGVLPAGQAAVRMPWDGRSASVAARGEGIVIPGDVAYAAAGGVLPEVDCGAALVAARMASLDYLWNTVRVQGGAYGAAFGLGDSGLVGCYSYRDPDPARTLGRFGEIASYLRGVGGTRDDLDGYVIGAISDEDPYLTPRVAARMSERRFWAGVTDDMVRERRAQMLGVDWDELHDLADPVGDALFAGRACVLGPRERLAACLEQGLVGRIEELC